MAELVSVLIPAFNAERWVAGAVRSALDQTWPNIEVIIVDDGSSDKTLEVCRHFASERVKVIAQTNTGAYGARNRALEESQGSYLQWLDCDDLLHPEKISRQMQAAQEAADRRVLLSGAHGMFFYRPERATFIRTSLWRDCTPIEYYLSKFGDNVWLQTGVWLVSRELTEAAGPWLKTRSPDDDGEYFCRVVSKSAGVKFVDGAFSYFRVGNVKSLGHARSAATFESIVDTTTRSIRCMFSLEDSPRTRAAAVQMIQSWYPEFLVEESPLAAKLEELAGEFGGKLYPPPVKWKYLPTQWLFGYPYALKLSHSAPRVKRSLRLRWDSLLYRLSHRPTAN